MANITYIFSNGRKEKIDKDIVEAKEFFYGYFNFQEKGHNVRIIEFSKKKGILKLFDRILNKFISLPFNSCQLTNFKNIKIMNQTDNLILVNEKVACSSVFLLIYCKIFTKVKVTFFVMGLYSKKLNFPIFRKLHHFTIKFLIKFIDDVIFLGEGEYFKALKFHKQNNKKLHLLPFAVDTNFWQSGNIYDPLDNKFVLFVGNDGNRDYELLELIIDSCKEIKFKAITNNFSIINKKSENLEVIKAKWDTSILTDSEIREIYNRSKFVILPLKDSYQPSGQSVTLQSMNCKIPVMISLNKGFWEKDAYIDKENILFIRDNSIENWIEQVTNYFFNNNNQLKIISKNAFKQVNENNNIEDFYKKLENIVLIN